MISDRTWLARLRAIGSSERHLPIIVFVAALVFTVVAWRYVTAQVAMQSEQYFAAISSKLPLAVLITGVILSVLLTLFVSVLTRRERGLMQAARHVELALAAGRTGTWSVDLATGMIELDDRACAIWGFPPGTKASQQEIEQRIAPVDRRKQRAALQHATDPNGEGEHEGEYRINSGDSAAERWVVIRGQAEFVGGCAIRIFGTIRDITERKSVEQALAQSQLRLAGLIDQANDGIISIDRQQRITLFNRGAETMFGYASAEVIGQPLDLLIPKRAHAAHAHHIETFGKGSQASRRMGDRSEIFGLRKDGAEFPAEASISRLDLPTGPIFTAIVRDITDRKRQQTELEERVAERTRDLQEESRRREVAQAALVQAQRMDVLGQLTGGIAHDSNNLLTVISGNLEMIEDEIPGHPALKYLREAQEAANMGARLNQRLLTFSRRRKLEAQVINLNDQVVAMNELLRRTLGEDINLTTFLAHDLWQTRADPSEMENAILNLAINARDAMPRGGDLRLETQNAVIDQDAASLEDGLAPGDYACLSVSDTGIGMAPEVLRRVFEPFFTTKGPGKGTGLGLSTLYGFAKQSKGHVSIYSEVGRGTTVNLYLPRIADTENASSIAAAGATITKGNGELILVVEDNPQVRTLTLVRLKRLGYRTLEAENGPAAVAVLTSATRIDLVFSDVVMPGGMSGFELAQIVRERWPGLRVLLTSGFSEDAARGAHLPLENQKLLRKPYSLAELAHQLRSVIDG